jgi:ubiquitin carboxyl-terminal hydrolase 4/11/15
LKRFKRKGNKSVKNQAMVDFPVNSLDLGQICEVSGVYSLYAVVQHMGSLEGGHYNAVCKGLDEKWRLFDDDIVRPITFKVTPAAYILFYRKINS